VRRFLTHRRQKRDERIHLSERLQLARKWRSTSSVALRCANQKLLSLGPQYEIVSGGETVAVVKKHLFTPFRARFTVDVPGPDYRAVRNTRIRSSSASSAAANPRSRGRRDCT